MQDVITAEGLTKRFGQFTAVDAIDFSVAQGEIFGFLGPNGSGKTTTIRMMLGLIQPSAGKITTLGVDVTSHPERIRPRVGYMSQRFSLYNDLTVSENLRFYARVYGLRGEDFRQGVQGAVEMAGLKGHEGSLTRDLSGGWRQRLALAAAILHRPELVILDEPTAGVDPLSRRDFWDLLYKLVGEGTTIFVTTHYMDEAEHCHRLAFIQSGRIIARGSPASIKTEMMQGRVLEISPDHPNRAVEVLREAKDSGRLPVQEISLYGARLHVVANQMERVQTDIREQLQSAGVHVEEMAIVEPSLEDVFVSCMR